MTPSWRVLRSPGLALGTLAFLAVYCGAATWFPWEQAAAGPPAWAAALHLDRPFSSPAFLAATALLFLSTAACTWDRTKKVAALWRGEVRPWGTPFPVVPGASFADFCRREGFRGSGPVLFRFRPALWGGWLFHAGLLLLVAGVLLQRGFHDGGAFQLAEGEELRLDAPGAVFGRERGPFASATPPALAVSLEAFDPFHHPKGYAPDRACVLRVREGASASREGPVDRAAGFDAGPVTIYQAIPSGLALNVELAGIGSRTFHLREEARTRLGGSFTAPGGSRVRITVESERPFDEPAGTGLLQVRVSGPAGDLDISQAEVFAFGTTAARLDSVVRWGGFTYARSPGMPAVFAGFGALLLGAALAVFPAGVALAPDATGDTAGWLWVSRGRDVLLSEWHRASPDTPGAGGP